ncbi:IS66 family insertion sequence element accessory protein TnpB [Bradyrhizobium liaoningense]|nr:IS66 family insertion sequence element accessory protein TnpB [Bradyrhizobium liaoningense]
MQHALHQHREAVDTFAHVGATCSCSAGRTRTNLIKIIYWHGTGFCLFTKRLEHGVFLWPPSVKLDETLSLTSAQLSSLIEGVDWRTPEQRWRPAMAG